MSSLKNLTSSLLLLLSLLHCNNSFTTHQKAEQPHSIWSAEWSSSGKNYVVGGDDSTIWVYNANDRKLAKKFKLNAAVRAFAWHPTENLVAVATSKGIELLDLTKNKFTVVPGLLTGGRGIDWNKDGTLLAIADGYGKIKIINRNNEVIKSISKHNTNSYMALDWHPHKDILLVSSDEILLYDISGKLLKMIKHRKEQTGVLSVTWHPTGNFFVSGDYGHENEGTPTLLQFWKEDGTLIKSISGHHKEIRNLRWSPDGTKLASAADALRIWSINGDLLAEGTSKANLWGLAWNPNGQQIVTGTFANGFIQVWDDNAKPIPSAKEK
jgi:WD40 repeat protein